MVVDADRSTTEGSAAPLEASQDATCEVHSPDATEEEEHAIQALNPLPPAPARPPEQADDVVDTATAAVNPASGTSGRGGNSTGAEVLVDAVEEGEPLDTAAAAVPETGGFVVREARSPDAASEAGGVGQPGAPADGTTAQMQAKATEMAAADTAAVDTAAVDTAAVDTAAVETAAVDTAAVDTAAAGAAEMFGGNPDAATEEAGGESITGMTALMCLSGLLVCCFLTILKGTGQKRLTRKPYKQQETRNNTASTASGTLIPEVLHCVMCIGLQENTQKFGSKIASCCAAVELKLTTKQQRAHHPLNFKITGTKQHPQQPE